MNGPKFRAGMRVEIVGLPEPIHICNGDRFVLEGAAMMFANSWFWEVPEFVAAKARIVFGGLYGPYHSRGEWVISELYLRPIYDGDLPAKWEDCCWAPRSLEVVKATTAWNTSSRS